jgi:hypothetical protein
MGSDWQPRHVAARSAFERGDLASLCKACDLEIRTAVRKAIGKNPQLRGVQGINEALHAFACKGVEKAAGRYDPNKGKFQAYAWQDIYWETQRGTEALLSFIHEIDQGPGQTEEQQPQAPRRELAAVLETYSEEWWTRRIEDLDTEELDVLCVVLDTNRDELMREIGERKYWSVRGDVYKQRLAAALGRPGARFREISGPQHMVIEKKIHKSRYPLTPPLSKRRLAKMLGRSDKTIAAWETRIEQAGSPPPTLGADGSLTMKGQDLDDWLLYLAGIEDPRFRRRVERRRDPEPD